MKKLFAKAMFLSNLLLKEKKTHELSLHGPLVYMRNAVFVYPNASLDSSFSFQSVLRLLSLEPFFQYMHTVCPTCRTHLFTVVCVEKCDLCMCTVQKHTQLESRSVLQIEVCHALHCIAFGDYTSALPANYC